MPKNSESLRGVRILVVEDEVLIAEEIRERLSRLGAEIVEVVDSGPAALQTAERLRPDLVLMDIRLKGPMTGIEAAEGIRRELRIPVIFLTAHSDWETVLRAKKSDPFGYVLKPFQEADLVATVQVALHRHSLEQQLMESDRRFEATLSSIGEGVIAADAGGRITFMNPVAEALTQWPIADASGRAIEDVFSVSIEGIKTAADNPALLALRSRQVVQSLGSAMLLHARDGRRIPVDVSAAPIVPPRDDDQLLGTVVSFRDISDRKRLEESLRETAEQYRLLADNSSDTIWVMGFDEKFTYASPAVLNLCGYKPEEVRCISMEQLLTPPSLGLARSIIEQEARKPAAERWANVILELEVRCKDGSSVWTEASIRAIRDADGNVTALQGASRDITCRKVAQEKLRRSEQRFRAIFDQTFQFIGLLMPDGTLMESNRSALQFAGIREQDVLGKPFWETPWWSHSQELQIQLREAIQTAAAGQFVRLEVTHPSADGCLHTVDFSLKPVRDENDQVILLIPEGRDITERSQAEEALRRSEHERRELEVQILRAQKMEAIGQLAGGIAHDFNNLLTIILAQCETLLAQLPESDGLRFPVATINDAGERAASLTRQLLTFSRQTVVEPKVVDLNTVVADSEKLLRRLLGEDIRLTVRLESSLGRVKADPGQLQQIVVNLALNSRDAMPQGGELTIETSNIEPKVDDVDHPQLSGLRQDRLVMLSVTDTGCGMTVDEQSHIFEPFYTTKSQGKGTGLGLSVVHGIVKQSGGQIEVNSEIDRGTTFKIGFAATDEASTPEICRIDRSIARGGTEVLLLVEDEEVVRELTQAALQSLGYTVLAAASDKEAIRIAEKHRGKIDLLVTDVVLPGMNGRQLASALQDSDQNLKVVFISGYTSDAVLRRGVLHGEVEFLEKPFTPGLLASKIRKVLDRH